MLLQDRNNTITPYIKNISNISTDQCEEIVKISIQVLEHNDTINVAQKLIAEILNTKCNNNTVLSLPPSSLPHKWYTITTTQTSSNI